MSTYSQTLLGVLMMLVGGVKTWIHMGSVPVLSVPSCSGETLTIALNNGTWFEHAHCWGCYMVVAGLLVALVGVFRKDRKRRSVAAWMD